MEDFKFKYIFISIMGGLTSHHCLSRMEPIHLRNRWLPSLQCLRWETGLWWWGGVRQAVISFLVHDITNNSNDDEIIILLLVHGETGD